MWGTKEDYIDKSLVKQEQQKKLIVSQQYKQQKFHQRQNQQKVKDIENLQNGLPKIDETVQISSVDTVRKKKKRRSEKFLKKRKENENAENKIRQPLSEPKSKQMQQRFKQKAIKLVAKWSKQRQELEKKRVAENFKREEAKKLLMIKAKQQQEENAQFLRIEKRKMIEARIKQNENKKSHKKSIISSSTHGVLPQYEILQRNYQLKERENFFDEQISRKNRRNSMKMNSEVLKEHQRAYIQRIKQRLNMKKSIKNEGENHDKVKSQFDLYLNRRQQKVKQQQQKLKRRQKFQEKISRILISVDESKKIQREIAIDKSKNPHKYNFLSQKSLNDEQIYREFPNFIINTDSKQIGKQYLEKLKQEPRIRVSRSTTLKRSDLPYVNKPQYPNYLGEVKIRKNLVSERQDQPTKQVRQRKRSEYSLKKQFKKEKIRKDDNYFSETKKQKDTDSLYLKQIKQRLKGLQLK